MIEQNEDGGKRRNAAKKKELEATEKRIASYPLFSSGCMRTA